MLLACIFYLVVPLALATQRPIIGILAQEVDPEDYPGYSSFIAASYVKAVEQSGARVVPIFINRTEQYYKDILNSINGVVFPGGGVSFTDQQGFADTGRIILKYSKQMNNKGDYFPILGVCLGFELLVYLEVKNYDVLANCSAVKISLPLNFTKNFQKSRLYAQAPQDIIESLRSRPITYNHHSYCVTEDLLHQYKLEEWWHVLSTSLDSNNLQFVSSAEHHSHPIVGIIFHPEKIAYEWNPKLKIPHDKHALDASRYFYDWLAQEAAKSNHSFNSTEDEDGSLIYNYQATYVNSYYEQLYLFE